MSSDKYLVKPNTCNISSNDMFTSYLAKAKNLHWNNSLNCSYDISFTKLQCMYIEFYNQINYMNLDFSGSIIFYCTEDYYKYIKHFVSPLFCSDRFQIHFRCASIFLFTTLILTPSVTDGDYSDNHVPELLVYETMFAYIQCLYLKD